MKPSQLAALLLPLAACADSSGAAPATASDISFRYSGAREGVFQATGGREEVLAARTLVRRHPHAMVLATDLPAAGGVSRLQLYFHAPGGPALIPFERHCQEDDCAGGVLSLISPVDSASIGSYVITGGAMRIESVSGSRLLGSFSGTAQGISSGAVLRIAEGRFEVTLGDGGEP